MNYNTFKIDIQGDYAYVYTPKNTYFIYAIKEQFGGKWDGNRNCWIISSCMVDDIRKQMRFIYGQDDLTPPNSIKKVDVTITATKEKKVLQGPVTLFGIVLASAYSKDSGAKHADNVAYLEGGCYSGGSNKYWTSVVEEGSIIKIYDIPEAMLEPKKLPNGWEMKSEERPFNNDEEFLKHQKDLLQDSIAKIDKEIEKIHNQKAMAN